MLKISWTEHKTNDEELQLAEEQRTLMTITLRQRPREMVGICVKPLRVTKESNRRANERKKEAWQAKENVIRLVDEKTVQNGLFTAKGDGTRWNRMESINTRHDKWQNT